MTRLERAKAQAAKQAEKLAASKKQVKVEESKEKEQARKAHNRRCYKVGALMAEAGFFVMDDEALAFFVHRLTCLAGVTDPVGALEDMLSAAGYVKDWDDVLCARAGQP